MPCECQHGGDIPSFILLCCLHLN